MGFDRCGAEAAPLRKVRFPSFPGWEDSEIVPAKQQGGNHVIWFGLTWSLELYQQANKRLHRQGQTEKVIVHNLVVEGGMDADVITALEGKADTQDALMQSLKARITKAKER